MRPLSKLKPARIPVTRHVSEYSNEEVAHFRETIKSLLELRKAQFERSDLLSKIALGVMWLPLLIVVGLLQAFGVPTILMVVLIPCLMIAPLVLIPTWVETWVENVAMTCPGCSNSLTEYVTSSTFDRYCPECGGCDTLELRDFGRRRPLECVYCTGCKQYLYYKPGSGDDVGHPILIRVCTHCGLLLSDEGFSA